MDNYLLNKAMDEIKSGNIKKLNAIWLEATGCSGNIISFLNGENPGLIYMLKEVIDLKFNNSIMGAEGESAFEIFLDTLDTDFVLLVDGAISIKDNGMYTIIAVYKGKKYTAYETIKMAADKAKYIIAVGTCASYGGISAAYPNPSESKSVEQIINKFVYKLPGCPCHPDWVIGTLAGLLLYGKIDIDNEGRPIIFYGKTIHDTCPRRTYFNEGVFATKLGDEGCMFKLGCRGPVTKADCAIRKWDGYVNWPIGDNTPCIGCTQKYFPDGMEPFVKY